MSSQPETNPATIVVGLDDSETSGRAAAYALDLAGRTGARLVFVQVLNTGMLISLAPDLLPSARAAAEEAAAQLRERITDRLTGSGVAWDLQQFSGNPYVELIRVAEAEKADTIVVGASRRGGARLIGSLPAHLIKNHHWPVIVVP